MADIRINSLPTTATSFNTDDYIALDGTSGGTRKMLAATLPLTDVTFGSSGPSAKSSIAARASRQGLLFDGTSGVYTGIISGPSTNDFTTACWVNPTSFAASGYLFGNSQPGSFYLGVRVTTGALFTGKSAGASFADTTFSLTAGKNQLLVRVKSGSSVTWYLNGVAIQSGITDSNDYNGGFEYYGSANSSAAIFTGTLIPLIYNRALSAAEVVALYEAGVPAGADYNTASNTAANTQSFATTGIPYTTFGSASTTGFSATSNGSGSQYAEQKPTLTIALGQRFLATFTVTLNSGTAPKFSFSAASLAGGLSSNEYQTVSGSNSVVLTATKAGSPGLFFYNNSTTSDYVVSNFSITRLGLLLAPDAGQAGGGLTWYDTSGNAANITLPASGVSWNVPSSRYLGGNWTTTGDLTVSGTGTSTFGSSTNAETILNLTNVNAGSASAVIYRLNTFSSATDFGVRSAAASAFNALDAGSAYIWYNGATSLVLGATNATGIIKFNTGGQTEKARIAANGNVLIGTTTDSGNGKMQLTSHTTSASGIGFGTETALYRAAAGSLVVDHIGGSAPTLNLSANGAIQSRLFFNGTNTFLESYTSHSLILRTNQTTALTLDSSQNATFAKTVNVGNGTSNSSYQNIYTNKSENTAGPVSITLPADCAGTVRVSSFQSGVGRSFRTIPFINFGGTVTLGTSDTTVVTADPVTSVAAGTGAVTLNLVAANTNVYWGIDVVKA